MLEISVHVQEPNNYLPGSANSGGYYIHSMTNLISV